MKKVISLLLALVLVFSCTISAFASTASDVQTTTEPSEGLFVRADGVLYEVEKGQTYTYTLTLSPDKKVSSFDATIYYDSEGVTPVFPVNEYGDLVKAEMFPVFGIATVWNALDGEILFNFSSVSGIRFGVDKRVVTLDFKVDAESGIYDIYTEIDTLAVVDGEEFTFYIDEKEVVVDESLINRGDDFTADVYVPTEPTQAPTEEPTDAPEHFYVAAGDEALFGSNWVPSDRNNELLPNGDGTYSKVYENVAADTYYFKVTTDGEWDIGDYNLEGDANYGGPSAVVEVLYDGATVTIGFDGTKATVEVQYVEIPATQEQTEAPTQAPTEKPSEGLFVRADGVLYEVEKGQTYTYTLSLSPDKKVASFDATIFYDAQGVTPILPVDEYGDLEKSEMFPVFGTATVYNADYEDKIKFNFSSADGIRFGAEKRVIVLDFKVNATEGIYDIYTDIISLAVVDGLELVDYIYDSKVIVDESLINRECDFNAEVYVPTESTQAPTEEPTVAPTEEPTEVPTEEPTQTPTEKPAEGLFVRADGVLYEVEKGQTYTYTLSISPDKKVGAFDATIFYDAQGVTPILPVDEYGDLEKSEMFPVFGSATVYNADYEDKIKFNFSSADGIRFGAEKRVIVLDFKVNATEGIYDIYTEIDTMAVVDGTSLTNYIYGYETLVDESLINRSGDFSADVYVPTEVPTEEPSEVPTEEPTVEEPTQTPTEKPSEGLFVRADGVLYEVEQGKTYTYTLSISPDKKVASFNATTFYDAQGVSLVLPVDEYGDLMKSEMFPVFGSATVCNYDYEDRVKFNYSSADGIRFGAEKRVVAFDFTVNAAEGIYDIYTDIVSLAVVDGTKLISYIYGSEALVDESLINLDYTLIAKEAECEHVEVIDYGYEATCEEDGLTDGSHCSKCDEVLVEQEVIKAKGHTEVADKGYAPTCEEEGLTDGSHCSVCSKVLVAQEVIKATGHTEVADKGYAPTCEEEGLTDGSHCSVCSKVLVAQEVIKATGHTEVADKGYAPTCEEEGLTDGSHCSVCSKVLVAQEVIKATGHTEVADKGYAPTCEDEGLTDGSHCSVCSKVLVAQEVIKATGHKPIITPAIEATCESAGRTKGSSCDTCGKVFIQSEIIPQLSHNIVSDNNYLAPTCEEDGHTASHSCTLCNKVIYESEVIPAAGHNYVFVEGKEPTYTEEGYTESVVCSNCKHELIPAEIIPMLEYMLGDVDGDGSITILDATAIQLYLAEMRKFTEKEFICADINKSGEVDILDATRLQMFLAEMIDKL